MKQPKEIVCCLLEVIVMPNGEIICLGKTLGSFKDYKEVLTIGTKRGLKQCPSTKN